MNEQREDVPYRAVKQRNARRLMLAQKALYRERSTEMFCLALHLCLRPKQAEDVVQTLWQKFFEQGSAFTEENVEECRA